MNISISESKLPPPPTTNMVCLGIEIDSVNQTLSIPKEKIQQILENCQAVLKKPSISKKGLQSLIGSLMFIHKAVKPARVFVNRLIQCLRECVDCKAIQITEDFVKDIHWFLQFLEKYNGVSKYVHPPVNEMEEIALDACLTGFGAVYGEKMYTFHLAAIDIPPTSSIVHLEMWNILSACRVWGRIWSGSSVHMLEPNLGVSPS